VLSVERDVGDTESVAEVVVDKATRQASEAAASYKVTTVIADQR
jgi:hypothetical protein